MPKMIDRGEVQRLMEDGAQVVEVLPPEEYEDEHLARAVNIPLKELDRNSVSQLQRDLPVITYCADYQ